MRMHTNNDVVDAENDEPVVTDEPTTASVVATTPFSPAQIIGLAVGIGFVVLGIAALNTTGSPHWFTPHRVIWHLGHSPLLGWSEIAFGALLVLASIVPGAVRSLMAFLGAVSLILGIVILVDAAPTRLHHWLGVTHTNGWLYAAVGAGLVLTAFAAPVFMIRRRERPQPVNLVRS
jgi:hypothetical protein